MKIFKRSPWLWVPTLAFSDGFPLVAVMTLSVILYKQLGLSNAAITFYTSWLYLPWVLKPVWSPFVDLIKTKRWWVLTMEVLVGAALGGIAFTIPTAFWLQGTLFSSGCWRLREHAIALRPTDSTCWGSTGTSRRGLWASGRCSTDWPLSSDKECW